jgi:cation diffusion facilitator CzcD-associated flavoprotein CzcO
MIDSPIPHNHVAIIGTGFGGLATAIRLQQDGFRDFVLLERANEIGGSTVIAAQRRKESG